MKNLKEYKYPDHVSYTYKSVYDMCPFKCWRQYHTKEFKWLAEHLNQTKSNFYSDFGVLIHDLAQLILNLDIRNKIRVIDISIEMANLRLKKYSIVGAKEDFWMDDLLLHVNNLYSFFEKKDMWDREFGTEQYYDSCFEVFDKDTGSVINQKMIGFVDLWYRDGDDVVIVDYKTGEPKTQRQVDQMDQLTVYTWLIQDNLNKFDWPVQDVLTSILFTRNGRFYVSKFRDDDEIDDYISDISEILENQNFEVVDKPPKFLCDSCDGAYNCKYLRSFRSTRKFKKK